MAEPAEIADHADPVIDGVWHWEVSNSNIGGATSSCHELAVDGEVVLVDPIRLAPGALAELPRPTAIVLTAKCHQRSAWRYRAEFGAPVWAPDDAPRADEEPDHRYADSGELPGGLRALRTPGPEPVHYCVWRGGSPSVLFCSDLLSSDADGRLRFVPAEYHDDPAETRRSVQRLLGVPFEVLCLAHGPPLVDDPKRAIRELLGVPA
jgi:metallo-beta-lactamase superfamily protein